MIQARYRGVLMAPEIVAFLRKIEGGDETLPPPLLYLLLRACRPTHLFVGPSLAPAARTWLGLGLGPYDSALPLEEPYDLALLGAASEWPPSVKTLRQGGLLMLPVPESGTIPEIAGVEGEGWRQVVVEEPGGQHWLLASPVERPLRYQESPREAFMALLLAAMQPETLALGPNVVFDGSLKPRATKVNFSGMGGQIGAGDLLLVYPEDLARFSPLPGATALLLGAVETPIQALHLALPFEEGALTLVVA